MTIPYDVWNKKIVEPIARWRILGANINVLSRSDHPWKTSVSLFSSRSGDLTVRAQVRPGFVDGAEVTVEVAREDAPTVTLNRLGEDFEGLTVPAWLSEGAEIDLPVSLFRPLGSEAQPGSTEPVPDYFLERGVAAQSAVNLDLDTLTITTDAAIDGDTRRLLRAVDLVLQVPRPNAVVIFDTSGSVPALNVVFSEPADGPRIFAARKYAPLESFGFGTFALDFADTPYDHYLLATVYLLSPPGVPDGSEPDLSWTSHVKHRYFRNLNSDSVLPDPVTQSTPITFPALTFGSGIIQQMIDELNTDAALAEILLAKTRVDGRVWTI